MFSKKVEHLLKGFNKPLMKSCVRGLAKKYEPVRPRLSSKPSNTPHPPKDPPEEGYDPKFLDHVAFQLPYYVNPAVFREFKDPNEKLGPDAAKNKDYKNPEYFSYHRYSFAQMQTMALKLRDERQEGGGLQVLHEEDDDDDEDMDIIDEDFSVADEDEIESADIKKETTC